MPRKKKVVKEIKKVIPPKTTPKPEPKPILKQPYANKRCYIEYSCPGCHAKYKDMAIGNALIIAEINCAVCNSRMSKNITKK